MSRWSQRFRWYTVSAFLPCHVFVQHYLRFLKALYLPSHPGRQDFLIDFWYFVTINSLDMDKFRVKINQRQRPVWHYLIFILLIFFVRKVRLTISNPRSAPDSFLTTRLLISVGTQGWDKTSWICNTYFWFHFVKFSEPTSSLIPQITNNGGMFIHTSNSRFNQRVMKCFSPGSVIGFCCTSWARILTPWCTGNHKPHVFLHILCTVYDNLAPKE